MSFILDSKQKLLVTYPICSYNYFHLEGKQYSTANCWHINLGIRTLKIEVH